MENLISRAAVKSAFIEYRDKMKVLTPFEINRLVDLYAIIKDLEAVDAVVVVHCKDCKHAHLTYDGECKYCDVISMADEDGDYGGSLYLPGDWYCAAGERRENDADGTTR